MIINKKLFFSFLFVFFLLSSAKIVLAEEALNPDIVPPIILETAEIKESGGSQIMVSGLVAGENQVLIYLNGTYNGLANISQGNANFYRFSFLSPLIKNVDSFKVLAIAQNKDSRVISAPTENIVSTIIEKSVLSAVQKKPETIRRSTASLPPPTLLTPKQSFCESKPYISGFSKNDSLVKIFINKKLYDKFWVVNRSSSTAFFSYIPSVELDRGQYSVYAIAEDKAGNKSTASNILNFCISRPQTTSSSTIQIQENEQNMPATQEIGSSSTKVFQKTLANITKVEQKNKDSKFNLIIFLVFVVIIIIWMVIVNKELINEKNEEK